MPVATSDFQYQQGTASSYSLAVALTEPDASTEVWTVVIEALIGGAFVRVGNPIVTRPPATSGLSGARVVAQATLPGVTDWRAVATPAGAGSCSLSFLAGPAIDGAQVLVNVDAAAVPVVAAPGPASVVWQPGGPAGQAANIYTQSTPAAAMLAFQALAGEKVFFCDDTFGLCTFPAGNYDAAAAQGNATFAGVFRGSTGQRVNVLFDFGAHLTGRWNFRDATLDGRSITTPVYSLINNQLVEVKNSNITASGTQPFFAAGAGVTAEVWLFDRSRSVAGTAATFATTDVTAVFTARLFDGTRLGVNTVVTLPGSNTTVSVESSAANPTTQAGLTTLTVLGDATHTLYAPGVPANWVGTPPANVNDAIDRMAAALVILIPGPIP